MRGGLWTNKIQAVRNSPNSMYEGFAHGKTWLMDNIAL
jgi:hypothetical protein